jgi:hypothetical protein
VITLDAIELRTAPEIDGEVPNTFAPEPVEVVTPVPPFATGRVPVTPVVKGKPVTFVIVPEDGIPSTGAVRVGLVIVGLALKTTEPVPVEAVTPVPPLATGKVPVTSVVRTT